MITPETAGWGYSSLRVITLDAGESFEFGTESDEMIVLPLTGGVDVTIGDTTFELTGRESVFTGVTDTAYLPIDSRV
ncbi:MAG: 5-deoxy-glucuronate isomerase, partial [Nakamurella sp.]